MRILVTDVAETPPPAPQNLTAESTSTSVTLAWEAPDDSTVSGYRILRKKQDEDELVVHVEDTGSVETSYTDEAGVESDTSYVYRIKAINAAGFSEWSNHVRITTVQSQ